MKSKCIEYAYPSSELATSVGMGDTGCWFIGIYPTCDSCIRETIIPVYHCEKFDALKAAETIELPYNHMMKYFNPYLPGSLP